MNCIIWECCKFFSPALSLLVYLSVYLSIYLSICLSVYLFIYLFIYLLYLYTDIYIYIYIYIYSGEYHMYQLIPLHSCDYLQKTSTWWLTKGNSLNRTNKRWNWSSCIKLALSASWIRGLIAQSVRVSERSSVVVGSNPTPVNFL